MKLTYGIPLWLMKKYLVDLGGTETGNDVVEGAGWRAELRQGEPKRLGSLVIGRIEVEITGEDGTVEALLEKLHWKTLRGGG